MCPHPRLSSAPGPTAAAYAVAHCGSGGPPLDPERPKAQACLVCGSCVFATSLIKLWLGCASRRYISKWIWQLRLPSVEWADHEPENA